MLVILAGRMQIVTLSSLSLSPSTYLRLLQTLSIVADVAKDVAALPRLIVVELYVVCPPEQLQTIGLKVNRLVFR